MLRVGGEELEKTMEPLEDNMEGLGRRVGLSTASRASRNSAALN